MQLSAAPGNEGRSLGASLVAAALALPALQPAHADNPPESGQVAIKLLDYRDSQPGAERIKVRAPSFSLLTPVGSDWSVTASVVADSISGASPAYHTSGLSKMHDFRRALDLSVSRYFANATLTLGGTVSSESDYLARGLSAQASFSSDDRNTTWTAGLGLARDRINPSNGIVEDERKRTFDVLAGVTQVLGTHDIAQLNFGYSRGRGYFSDPYKVFDNRPRERDHRTMLARWNHHFESSAGTLRSSYRYYSDTYGVKAHTLGFEYVQPFAAGWTVTPLVRLYTQSAARFYVAADPSTEPFPPNPPADAEYFSEDQRLSAFGARTFGIKVARQIGADWVADVKVERYEQRGAWRWFGSGSTDLEPFRANMIQLGLSRRF